MKFIEYGNIVNKKVILRLDLNVTIKDNKILDDTKLKKCIPTIKYLLNNNNHILIMSHLGKIKTEEDKQKNSLKIVSERLKELLDHFIMFIPNTRGEELNGALNIFDLVLMENTRFEDLDNKKESNCDEELAKYWSTLGDVFVNDAFGTSHRKHASTYGISKYLPSYYGFLINEEINGLEPIINVKERPFCVIMGGAKVDDKIALIKTLLNECDYLLVGGGIANTFLKAKGYNIGLSLHSEDYVSEIKELIEKYRDKIYMPLDVIVKEHNEIKYFDIDSVTSDSMIYDIGSKTLDMYREILNKSKIIFVNGTMGLYEQEEFKTGTESIYQYIAQTDATCIAGGGDALASINNLGYKTGFDFLSTGGGATLEYIANKKIAVFED